MNDELVSVEGLVLEKMMVLDESDDAVLLKNTRYDVDDVGDAGDDRGDRVEKQRGIKPGDGIKRFAYRELMTQRGTGKYLMILRFLRCIEVADGDTVSVIVIIITIIITLLLLISIISIIIIIRSIIFFIILFLLLSLFLSSSKSSITMTRLAWMAHRRRFVPQPLRYSILGHIIHLSLSSMHHAIPFN